MSLAIPSVARNRWHEPSHFFVWPKESLFLTVVGTEHDMMVGFPIETSIHRVFSHVVHDFPRYQSLILLAANAHLGDCRLQQGGPGSL